MRKNAAYTRSVTDPHLEIASQPGQVFGLTIHKISRTATPAPAKKSASKSVRKKTPAPPPTPKKKRQPLENGDWDLSQFQVPEEKGRKRFHDFDLPLEVMHAISDLSFHYCTPIQAEILAHTLQGRDATGKAQTGTGKSAAFLINILTTLLTKSPPKGAKNATPRSLIIAPTRELVMQIAEDAEKLAAYSDIHIVPIYGGMDYQKQLDDIQGQQVDIVAATPGRLLDFQRKRQINLSDVEIFVIDEADRMLDMGFIPDVRQIVHSLPDRGQRQTLFFSATLTPEVNHLADQWTKDPAVVEIETEHATVDSIDQLVYLVTTDEKFPLLYNLIVSQDLHKVIVFCNRKSETRELTDLFKRHKISCGVLSGDVDQKKRVTTLNDFKEGKIRILVATDVAGRGIHIEGISHVVNYNLPYDPEDYVHRIGRTGRAGATGTSVSFACEEDSFYLPDIEEFIGRKLTCIHPAYELLAEVPKLPPQKRRPRPSSYKGRRSPRKK
ncbi:MAG: ATP-dependent RNA helicase RhlB [Desulfobulbaceae bacterium]|nr:MAG: ATP-dependent RNA helicase RhlB [Desulfobulbaceae bacterium]